MYKIADAHTHIYSPKVAQRATAGIHEFYNFPGTLPEGIGTHDHLYRACQEGGISRCLICQVAMKPTIIDTINDFLLDLYHTYPDFYIPFASIHQDCENKPQLVEKFKQQGFFGIKLHPDYQKFNMDDPMMDDFYDTAAQLDLPVLIHTGDKRYDYSNPMRLRNILLRFPKLTAIGAHFGGFSQWDLAYECLQDLPNVMFDTSSALQFMPPSLVRQFLERFGVERFMFGSDYPLVTPPDELKKFLSLGLDDDVNQAILYDNFARLFHLD